MWIKSNEFKAILLLLICSLAVPVFSRPPITSVKTIRNLAPERAAEELPVLVEGQVLWVHPTGNGFFVYAEDKGIYVHKPGAAGELAHFSAGDVVRVKGQTNEGYFSPSIFAESIELLRHEPLPEARPFHDFEQYSATIDCDWVWLVGRILSKRVQHEANGSSSVSLEVEHNNAVMVVQMPLSGGTVEKIDELMFKRVRFNAVSGTQFNINRQVVGRTFFVNSVDDFSVVDDFTPKDGIEFKPVHELLRSGTPHHRMPAGIHGLVTHVDGNHLYLRDEKACIKVTVRDAPNVVTGDYVELEGYVLPRPISPSFVARKLRVLEHREPPVPAMLQLNEELRNRWDFNPDSSLNHELVQVEAQLVDVSESFGLTSGHRERTLLCRHGSYLFEAKIPAYVNLKEELEPGATIRLKGICNLTRSEERRWRLYVDWFWIQLRDGNDIEILVAAPWWNTARLLWLLGAVLGIAALFIFWVGLLRRQVDKQTGIIGKQIERETISEERQRIARELHDNLEQGLAGMAIQLRGAQRVLELNREKRLLSIQESSALAGEQNRALTVHLERAADEVVEDAERNKHAIDVVQGMLTHCSHESRTSILDLRGGLLERMDLVEAIRTSLQPLADECGAVFKFEVKGGARRLKQVAERHLLLILKEAASNATRHGAPENLFVVFEFCEGGIAVVIADDGCGFKTDALPKVGHFGLQGMHERINQLKGTLQIISLPGEGTTVQIDVPDTAEWELG